MSQRYVVWQKKRLNIVSLEQNSQGRVEYDENIYYWSCLNHSMLIQINYITSRLILTLDVSTTLGLAFYMNRFYLCLTTTFSRPLFFILHLGKYFRSSLEMSGASQIIWESLSRQ